MEDMYHFEGFILGGKRQRFYNLKRSTDFKEAKINEADRYVSEGNPNTEETIKEAQEGEGHTTHNSSRKEDPKQYLLSDAKLAQRIHKAIESDESLPIDERQSIEVNVHHGTVTLTGAVYSVRDKKIIRDKAVIFVGHGEVINQIEVLEEE